MRVCLRLSDQDSLTSIGVATLSNIARVGNPGIVLENVSAVHHLLKEWQVITNTAEHINIKHRLHGCDNLGLYIVKHEPLKISLRPRLHRDTFRDLHGHVSAASIELGD